MKPEQILVVENIVRRKDVFAALPTGFGKSIAFQILPSVKKSWEGATSEYPTTHALRKSTATVVRSPQSASKFMCKLCTNAPDKVNPDPPPRYRWGLVLIARKKRQIPHHAGQEIAENAPPLGPDEFVVE